MADEWQKLLINYRTLNYSEPPSMKNYDNLLALIKFFVEHCEVFANGTVAFRYHLIPKECLTDFNEANKNFPSVLEPTIQSLLNILHWLGTLKRISQEQKIEVNAVLEGKDSLAETLAKIWDKRLPPGSVRLSSLAGLKDLIFLLSKRAMFFVHSESRGL